MWRILNRLLLMLTQTLAVCCVTAGQQCHGDIFEYEQYNYKIWNDRNRTISEAIELADQTNSSLLVIERPEIQQVVIQQMQSCNIAQVFLGIKQIESARLLTDSAPWSWISDCDDPESGVISFQGCFMEDYSDRELSVLANLASNRVTGDTCISRCRELGQKYAGIQQDVNNLYSCYCGQSYGKHGAATGCSYTCPEGTSHSCGGVGQNSVYHTKNNTFWGSWLKDRPQYNSSYAFCASIAINVSGNNVYFLKERDCEIKLRYLCKYHEASDFDNSMCHYNGCNGTSCYCLRVGDTKTWHKAKFDCRKQGGDLAVIEPEYRINVISTLLYRAGMRDDFWVGASRQTYRRLDNDNILCYSNFDQKIDETRIYVYMRRSDGGWRGFDNLERIASTITQSLKTITQPEMTSEEPAHTTEITEQPSDEERTTMEPETTIELDSTVHSEPIEPTTSIGQNETIQTTPTREQSNFTNPTATDNQEASNEPRGYLYTVGLPILIVVIVLDAIIILAFICYKKKHPPNEPLDVADVPKTIKKRVPRRRKGKRNQLSFGGSEYTSSTTSSGLNGTEASDYSDANTVSSASEAIGKS